MKRLTVRGGVMLAWLGGPGAWPADRARGAVYTRVNLVSALAGVARLLRQANACRLRKRLLHVS